MFINSISSSDLTFNEDPFLNMLLLLHKTNYNDNNIYLTFIYLYIYIHYTYSRVESKNDFLESSPKKRALRMCYSEPLYEERKKQPNSTTNAPISEETSPGLREILRCTIHTQQKHNPTKTNKRATRTHQCESQRFRKSK